jgi:cell division septal protein FtsQ
MKYIILLLASTSAYADNYTWQEQVNDRRQIQLQREMLNEQRQYNFEMKKQIQREQRSRRYEEYERDLNRTKSFRLSED